MTQAIRLHQTGGPEVLRLETLDPGLPGPGEALIEHHAIGLNYIDIYHRSGLYPLPLPSGIGLEGAGVVVSVGEGVTELMPGDRVAYAGGPVGAYAQQRLIPADRLVKLPGDISFEQGAAMMLQGMTAQYLLCSTYRVKQGDTLLIHAAAGGVGLLVCQWARALGATVIGTVSSDAKAQLAADHGCHHPIVYTRENFVERVKQITLGQGVPVVYDSIGQETFMGSLSCLQPRGLLVSFGNASGPVPPLDLGVLAKMGSLYITRPTLFNYTARRDDLLESAQALFEVVKQGSVRIEIHQRYSLAEAARAHQDLEQRNTTGASILLP
jgi:NADPH2:quinone reductase